MPSKRIILDEFDVPNHANANTITIKDVVCADMDGDGVDEILVSVDCEGLSFCLSYPIVRNCNRSLCRFSKGSLLL